MKRRGFTLAEIMIVVAIIGLLAGLAVPIVFKRVNGSRIKQAESDLAMISTAFLQMAWDTGVWPNGKSRAEDGDGTSERWDFSEPRCGLLATDGSHKNWKGPYYDGPLQDPWGNPYFFDPDYRRDGVHVVVGSFGPNGVGRNRYDDDDVYVLLDD